ncbi:MAG: HAD-IIIA family hydrolase [Candidatus Omnitrophica bacterium]|nr:HAD-IIIA family hydrolase [Candidatus Omnitrophota bacterium]
MKIVFLDRDGVVNQFPGNGEYVTKLKNFSFIPGSLEAIRLLTENGYRIFIISNQAGVAKGVYSMSKLKLINRKMLDGIKKAGGKINKTFYCTHRSDEGCHCRKPEIGSIIKALKSVGQSLQTENTRFFVGDSKSDILTGFRSGCRTILVLSGRAKRKDVGKWGVRPEYIVKNLQEATKIIIGSNGSKEPA